MMVSGISTHHRCAQRISSVYARHVPGYNAALQQAIADGVIDLDQAVRLRDWIEKTSGIVLILNKVLINTQTST